MPRPRLPIFATAILLAAVLRASAVQPVFQSQTDRPLRYTPQGTEFVIENGQEYFNRPLYGSHTAFRVDASDRPEFSFYLPGRGGNLRLGVQVGNQTKWLHEAEHVVGRYRPGGMAYEVRDPLLGAGLLRIAANPLVQQRGLILRVELEGATQPVELLTAFGGANGERGSRNGDIGTEKEPVTQFFQLKPEYCADNRFRIDGATFLLNTRAGQLAGVLPAGTHLLLADARRWSDLAKLLEHEQNTTLPVVVGQTSLAAGHPLCMAIHRLGAGDSTSDMDPPAALKAEDLPKLFDQTEEARRRLAGTIVVDTPDPYVNAAAAALCVAADGVWDEIGGAVMHGAVAWRNRLLGWRGPYALDELGWHERMRRHLAYWARQQNTRDDFPTVARADPTKNLATDDWRMLHSNGSMSDKHYDMNLAYIDAYLRHALWTGDLEFLRQTWPVLERHLAWEQRCFRRPFGNGSYPLYEAYCCIWASDDLQYNGGGVTHSSAMNYYHNLMAARIARALGKDASPYEKEARLILEAMQHELYIPEQGIFAEFKDLLANQLVHPAPAVWTYYHAVDSQVPDPFQAWQMGRYVDTQIPHIPIQGPGVPPGRWNVVASTNWLPYVWSTNNVVLAENTHTALADWQAGRDEAAFSLFKGNLLDSMFVGLCPGNFHMSSYFDAYRTESQRDFADPIGTTSRAFIEGLFGVQPDLLAGEVRIRPGFPLDWDHASLQHPDFSFSYRREGALDTYRFDAHFAKPVRLLLTVRARGQKVVDVQINGKPASWKNHPNAINVPEIEIGAEMPSAERYEVTIRWEGDAPARAAYPKIVAQGGGLQVSVGAAELLDVQDPQRLLADLRKAPHGLNGSIAGAAGARTCFVQVRQGDLSWWLPIEVEVRPPLELIAAPERGTPRLMLRNNTLEALDQEATVAVYGGTAKAVTGRLRAAPLGLSNELTIPPAVLAPGTNRLTITLADGRSAVGTLDQWNSDVRSSWRYETLDLGTFFNDRVADIFKHDYVAPRSPYCSLAIAKTGFGGWCDWSKIPEIDDSGLRATAAQNDGLLRLPQGIPLRTPAAPDARNIAFVSQWNNHPRQIEVPLSGHAFHLYLLMAGSTNSMQSRMDNGEAIVTYADGSTERLALRNPTNWWPIDQDYLIDDFAFAGPQSLPPRVSLKTGEIRLLDLASFKGKGGAVRGGAATVLDLPLDPTKPLHSLKIQSLTYETIVGLMSATVAR